jgi:cathepsin B
MEFLESTGLVSDDCFPYVSGNGTVPVCPTKCTNGGKWTKNKCIHKSTTISWSPDEVKADLYENGPVETGFTVYEDFMSYKSGIYRYTNGEELGGHAVKIIGWGVEKNQKYWICANSWGTTWGEKGFFKIEEGQCGIDDMVVSCIPKVKASVEELLQ